MSRYTQIDDNYETLEQVVLALIQAGLESTSLIVGIDFTKKTTNPYELAVSVIGETLSALNREDTNLIPCFGFGDGYKKFQHKNRSVSLQEQETIDAIVKASEYPLSIVLVGVGDGPWEMMREFDNNIPHRTFDNFQFVNLTEILSQEICIEKMHSEIALAALMEIPSQYLATLELQGLSHTHERWRSPLPPPTNHQQSPLPFPTGQQPRTDFANSAASSNSRLAEDTREEVVCPICLENSRDLAFGCGHRTCQECGSELSLCPICRTPISIRIKLYS
ncbi:hypothetical protein MKX01_029396 [Papaver californicum]|nr:hypothetical protein MKX01_029396 [Papaver californicum]